MSNLVEIYLPVNSSPKLYELLKTRYEREMLQKLWYDPFGKPRAVAMFEKTIERTMLEKELLYDKQRVIQKFSKPTWSVIVKLHKDMSKYDFIRTLLHKLSRQGTVNNKIKYACFEIVFKNGWDDVMAVCRQQWSPSDNIKSIRPFFDCFKKRSHDVSFNEFDEKKNSEILSPPRSSGAIPKQHNQILHYPSNSQSDLTTSVLKVTHPLLSILLDALNFPFEHFLIRENIQVEIDLSSFTILLEGPEVSVKKIKHLLCLESDKLKCSDQMNNFLKNNSIQLQIKQMVAEQHLHSVYDLRTLEVYLIDRSDHKKQLKDLQNSLLVEKFCAPLPLDYDRSIFEDLKIDIEKNQECIRLSVGCCGNVVLCHLTKHTVEDSIVESIKEFLSSNFKVKDFNLKDISTNTFQHDSSRCDTLESSQPENECSKFQRTITYPGLTSFLNSVEGNDILLQLSSKHKIPIDRGRGDPSRTPEVTPDLRVLFLKKANIGHFKLYLVQGSVEDVKVTKKILFYPTHQDNQCWVKGGQNASELQITLPPWKQFNEADSNNDYLLKLRKSLYKVVTGVFDIIEDAADTDVAFCTSEIHSTEFPFPQDLIAKCILEEMNKRNLTQYKNGACKIFILEPVSAAVFKAFNFFLGRRHIYLGEPDEDSWIKISYPDNKVYTPIRANIEVSSHSFLKKKNTLYCYPVDPNLNAYSSPIINEALCQKDKLIKSIKWFDKESQSQIGHCYKVNCFRNGAPAVLYTAPHWGPDCAQVIQDSLTSCLSESSLYETVHIIPPGLHVEPKYPKRYLTQTVLKVLHQLILDRKCLTEKHIVLVVDNTEYRKAFQVELEKYFVSKKRWALVSSINFHTKDESDDDFVIEGDNEKSIVSFKSDLSDKLGQLMAKNYVEIKLNRDETLQLQEMFSGAKNKKVDIDFKMIHEREIFDTQKKMYLHGNSPCYVDTDYHVTRSLTGSTLTIRALKKQWVEEFNLFITEIISNTPTEKPAGASNYNINSDDEEEY